MGRIGRGSIAIISEAISKLFFSPATVTLILHCRFPPRTLQFVIEKESLVVKSKNTFDLV